VQKFLNLHYKNIKLILKIKIMKKIILSLLVFHAAFCLNAQSVLRYNFNNVLSETNGAGPVLSVLGNQGVFLLDTLNEVSGKTKTVYRFENNSGFQFNNTDAGNFLGETYTIELYFVFDNLSSWKRVIDWKNRTTDKGAYVYNGQLNFYNYVYSGEAPVLAGEYTYYIVTRDGASKALKIFTDAKIEIEFNDIDNEGVLSADNVLNFFHDDLMVPNEASSGAVAMLNIYDYALDTNTIKQKYIDLQSYIFGTGDKKQETLGVYPNPAQDYIKINLNKIGTPGETIITIANLSGIVVFSNTYKGTGNVIINLASLNLADGIYIVKAETGTGSYLRKLVIQK
jgi:OOP family OmpA-OmpF porin